MTRNEKTAAIRAELKKRGWNSRQVSVRGENCTYSSAIRVVVKDPQVPLSVVRRIAEQHERVRRCEITHDILSGGNTFVDVEYASEVLEPYIKAILPKIPEEPGQTAEVVGFIVGREKDGHYANTGWWYERKNDDEVSRRCWDKQAAARGIVVEILSAEG
jgi:hypothetical protein